MKIRLLNLFFFSTVIVSLFTTHLCFAKNLSIMLYAKSPQEIQEKIIKSGIVVNKNQESNNTSSANYHITLGIIKNISTLDYNNLKNHLYDNLNKEIKENSFKVSAVTLLGCSHQYFVALPTDSQPFIKYNLLLNNILKSYKNGKYHLSGFYSNASYFPHMSLVARVTENIKINEIPQTLRKLNANMQDMEIKITKLEIK